MAGNRLVDNLINGLIDEGAAVPDPGERNAFNATQVLISPDRRASYSQYKLVEKQILSLDLESFCIELSNKPAPKHVSSYAEKRPSGRNVDIYKFISALRGCTIIDDATVTMIHEICIRLVLGRSVDDQRVGEEVLHKTFYKVLARTLYGMPQPPPAIAMPALPVQWHMDPPPMGPGHFGPMPPPVPPPDLEIYVWRIATCIQVEMKAELVRAVEMERAAFNPQMSVLQSSLDLLRNEVASLKRSSTTDRNGAPPDKRPKVENKMVCVNWLKGSCTGNCGLEHRGNVSKLRWLNRTRNLGLTDAQIATFSEAK